MRPALRLAAAFFLVGLASTAAPQVTVQEIKLRVDPAGARIRPTQSAVVQVRVYGTATTKNGTQTGRLQESGWSAQVKESNGGWLSKPFLYQGKGDEQFVDTRTSLTAAIFERGSKQYLVKDSLLYTAPAAPGKYTVEVKLGELTASVTIEVAADAPNLRPSEEVSFEAERKSSDPYRPLAEHYAPFIAQETWFQPKADYLARFDYDGDWRGDNNWDALDRGSSQAYVHYAVMETPTHWFLVYDFFHPRDYSDNCVVGTCHENDSEGAILTVRKDGSRFGRLQVMETLAHNNIYSYASDRSIKKGAHDLDGRVAFYQDSHPVVFLESGGHGTYSATSGKSVFSVDRMEFERNTGVTYVYKGAAERPRHANDRNVGYDLLPIYDQWWTRLRNGDASASRTFDEKVTYAPVGGRPVMRNPAILGAFLGRKFGSNKAKPFWGWHDERTKKKKILAVGQWGLDPAYAVSRNLKFPAKEPFSLDYTFNPYLDISK